MQHLFSQTQHEKIIEMCFDGEWHCQIEFWNAYIRSPHKRRSEIEEDGKYYFNHQPCIHGHRGCRDYQMVERTQR